MSAIAQYQLTQNYIVLALNLLSYALEPPMLLLIIFVLVLNLKSTLPSFIEKFIEAKHFTCHCYWVYNHSLFTVHLMIISIRVLLLGNIPFIWGNLMKPCILIVYS